MADREKNRGGGRLSEEDRTWETAFIKDIALDLEKRLTAGTDKEIRYDVAHRRWVYRDRAEGTGDTAGYMADFLREFENMRKMKPICRRSRYYRSEELELMEDVWAFTEWIKRSLSGEVCS